MTSPTRYDDLGYAVPLPSRPARVVSLVPSLTEALAASAPGLLVGATDWCTHPAGLDVARVRGTKNPDRASIAGLRPDLVVANKEENRRVDIERLRADGIPVWVTDIVDVPSALRSMERLFDVILGANPQWLVAAREAWSGGGRAAYSRVAVPIWRDPWMVVGGATYTSDLLARLGLANAFAGSPRYPHVDLAAIDDPGRVDLVLLPDEPYVFTETDGPEAFVCVRTRLVSGRLLTWYGPAMLEAHAVLQSIQ
jgi:ABC-type Fe3+-hydroxamate transport system substrate-binding protein